MSKIHIRAAIESPDLEAVRELCIQFREWLYERYPDEKDLIDIYYNPHEFDQLLADLPILHAPPDGTILLAVVEGAPAGCVMVQKFENGIAEMKRLFVSPDHRGAGVGVALGEAVLRDAKRVGYQTMLLETGPFHHEAKALYTKLGFSLRKNYYDPGPEWRDKVVCMEQDLTGIAL